LLNYRLGGADHVFRRDPAAAEASARTLFARFLDAGGATAVLALA
jgi:hypothetical protein